MSLVDYCEIEDLETHLSLSVLTQLTSDEANVVDSAVALEAIIYASTLINGYLRGRFTLPLKTHYPSPALNGVAVEGSSPPPSSLCWGPFPLLRILAIDIAVYRLYSRRMRTDIPEIIAQQYNDAIKMLRDIQKGLITLDDTDTLKAGNYRSNRQVLDMLFSKTVLNEY